ncbi:MAG: restriction endonuclease subunit S, partial [Nanoarchaeota archaeon]|nr:restriction endonuclease subunit S [Nanoarchaeota archaeon]
MEVLIFQTDFKKIGGQEQLRCDSKYRYFYDVQEEIIIDKLDVKYSEVQLKFLLRLNKTKTLKKGLLDDEYILIELDDIEPGGGEIKRERTISEIGSDKTLFGDSDILISKLMPQAGHIILNDKSKKYIGTTELIGFKIINSNINKKYLLYLLLSVRRNFELLTSGKTHPRIQIQDLLRIKIPILPKEIQEEIVKKIEKVEEEIRNEKQKLIPLQDVIEEVFIKYSIKNTKFEKKEFEVFTTDAISIGKQGFLRCGPQYRAFWDVHKGLLFENKTKYKIVKLGSVMKLHKTKTLKKGILDKEYILIELEDIESGNGKIINQ